MRKRGRAGRREWKPPSSSSSSPSCRLLLPLVAESGKETTSGPPPKRAQRAGRIGQGLEKERQEADASEFQ